MSNTSPQRNITLSEERVGTVAGPLTRKIPGKTAAQERAEKKQLEARLAWDIDKAIAETLTASQAANEVLDAPDWAALLDARTKHSATAWTSLDKALAPFCMGASGPINPKTGQYLTEIRMTRNRPDEIDQVVAGIEVLRPVMKRAGGLYEFRIKFLGAKMREKNWLSLGKDGRAQVLSSLHPSVSFEDLRSALAYVSEHRPAAENIQ
jgi:methionine synthase II (cobalamin-independent)